MNSKERAKGFVCRVGHMHARKFFLDTSALICLSGLQGSDLQDFRSRIEESNSELSTTHIQVDEKTKHVKFHESVVKKN